MSVTKYNEAVGRRKTATARVRIYEGKAMSTINDKAYDEYFADKDQAKYVIKPISVVGLDGKIYFTAHVVGGGVTGQVAAIAHGLGRSLIKLDPTLKSALRKAGYITRDPRMVERKKFGQVKARKKSQFSKR